MLQHSHPAVIALRRVRIEKDKSPENRKLLFDNLVRLRSLGLTFYQCSAEGIQGLLGRIMKPGDAPHLVSLELETHACAAVDYIDVPEAPPPSLSSLSLKDLRVSFPKNCVLKHITHLSLSFYPLFETSEHVSWFSDLLSRTPNLAHLHISDHSHSGPRRNLLDPQGPCTQPQPQPQPQPAITLPHLQRLSYFGPSQTYVYLLRHLHSHLHLADSIPPTTTTTTTTYHQLTFTEPLTSYGQDARDAEVALNKAITSVLEDRVRGDRIRNENRDRNGNRYRYRNENVCYSVKFSMTTKEEDGGGYDPEDPEAFSIRIMVLATPRTLNSSDSKLGCTTQTVTEPVLVPSPSPSPSPSPVLSIEYQSSSWEWMSGSSYFPSNLSKITDSLPSDAIEEIHIRTNMPLKDYDYDRDDCESGGRKAGVRGGVKAKEDAKAKAKAKGFLSCENVRTLRLEGLRAIDWMCDHLALLPPPSQNNNNNNNNATQTFPVFPHLTNLILHSISWTKESEVPEIFNASKDVPPVLDSVADVLEERAVKFGGRCRVGKVVVVGGVSGAWVRRVEKGGWVGEGVVWDERVFCDWEDGWDGEEGREDNGEEDESYVEM